MDEFLRFNGCTLFSYTVNVASPNDLLWLLLWFLLQLPWCTLLSISYVTIVAGMWALLLGLVGGLVAACYVFLHVALRG